MDEQALREFFADTSAAVVTAAAVQRLTHELACTRETVTALQAQSLELRTQRDRYYDQKCATIASHKHERGRRQALESELAQLKLDAPKDPA